MVSRIKLADATPFWYFVEVVSHKVPPVFVYVTSLKIRRLVVWGSVFSIEHFEGSETAFFALSNSVCNVHLKTYWAANPCDAWLELVFSTCPAKQRFSKKHTPAISHRSHLHAVFHVFECWGLPVLDGLCNWIFDIPPSRGTQAICKTHNRNNDITSQNCMILYRSDIQS